MAKIVIAGKANCPYFARVELLADKLKYNLPHFNLHKIVIQQDDWKQWLEELCNKRQWEHKQSPIIWRELVDRGGKGILIGGANEFQEFVKGYYGIESELLSDDMQKIAFENLASKNDEDAEKKEIELKSDPLFICITSANSKLAYHVMYDIVNGRCFGSRELTLRLYDDNAELIDELEGVKNEIFDMACTSLRKVEVFNNFASASNGADLVLILDDMDLLVKPLEPEEANTEDENEAEPKAAEIETNQENRPDSTDSKLSDLEKKSSKRELTPEEKEAQYRTYSDEVLFACASRFAEYGRILDQNAKHTCRVVIAGTGPLNFCAQSLLDEIKTSGITRQHIVTHSRFFERQAKGILARQIQTNAAGIRNLIIWGDPATRHFVDTRFAVIYKHTGAIKGPPNFCLPAVDYVYDRKWFENEYHKEVRERTKSHTEKLGRHPYISHAVSITSMISDWFLGAPHNEVVSLGVSSQGWYGIPEGIFVSLPVTIRLKGQWSVVQDIEMNAVMEHELQCCVNAIMRQRVVLHPNLREVFFKAEVEAERAAIEAARIAEEERIEREIAEAEAARLAEIEAAEKAAAEEAAAEAAAEAGDEDQPTTDVPADALGFEAAAPPIAVQ